MDSLDTTTSTDTPSRHGIGGNLPPVETPAEIYERLADTYSAMIARRDELLAGVARVPAVDDDNVAKIIDFVKQIKAAGTKATEAFKSEKNPFLEGGRAVDGYFKKITEPLADGVTALNKKLTAYQIAKEAEERRIRDAAAQAAREEAARLQKIADDEAAALRAEADKAREENNLAAAVEAEAQAERAAAAAHAVQREAQASVADLSRTRGEMGGVSSLRTEWRGELVDRATLDLEALRDHIPADALEQAIRSLVKAGCRTLAGARIYEHKFAVTR